MHILTPPLLTELEFDQYFENLAESNKLISHEPGNEKAKHYFRSIDHVIGTQLKDINLVMTKLPIIFEGDNIDSLYELNRYQLTMLKSVGTNAIEKDIQEALEICRTCNKQILSKLQYDSDPARGYPPLFSYFKIQQVSIDLLDEPKLTDGWVGTSATVTIGSMTNLSYNPEDWN